ncbi:hypothetical protein BZA70DRAFT_96749 [Myxozyma melibiosi]|uniref:Ubiquitin-like domain-containing protein n=1 Tax=Myxozyma melibiosi TaxID=54550 RepID=A0ABR1EY45_9ASCO
MAQVDELTFSKAFLSLLSNQPIKYGEDYVQDPKSLGSKPGLVILSPMPNPKRRKADTATASDSKQATITIKSLRAPKFNVTVSASYTDTIFTLKTKVSAEAKISCTVKLINKGKVVPDTKTVSEIVDGEGKAALMAMVSAVEEGAAESTSAAEKAATPEPMQDVKTEADSLDIGEDVWTAIEATLVDKLSEAKGKRVLKRLRDVWYKDL